MDKDDLRLRSLDAAAEPGPDRSFPRDRTMAAIKRAPSYARLAWSVGQDPSLSRVRKGAVLAAAGYVLSPIDAIPGIIPVLGQLDDLLIAVAAVRFALMGLSPERRRRHLEAAGLTEADIEADLATARDAGVYLVRGGLGIGARAARTAIDVGSRFARRGMDLGSHGVDEARGRVDHARGRVGEARGRVGDARGRVGDARGRVEDWRAARPRSDA